MDNLTRWIKHEFKGFYVLEVSDDDAERILEYGIDEIISKDTKKNEEDYLEDILL